MRHSSDIETSPVAIIIPVNLGASRAVAPGYSVAAPGMRLSGL